MVDRIETKPEVASLFNARKGVIGWFADSDRLATPNAGPVPASGFWGNSS